MFGLLFFARLFCRVFVKCADGLANGLQLVQQKIGGVVLVGFRAQECATSRSRVAVVARKCPAASRSIGCKSITNALGIAKTNGVSLLSRNTCKGWNEAMRLWLIAAHHASWVSLLELNVFAIRPYADIARLVAGWHAVVAPGACSAQGWSRWLPGQGEGSDRRIDY